MLYNCNKIIKEIINLENNINQEYKKYDIKTSEFGNLSNQYNNYMIDIFNENYKINYINNYDEFMHNMNINFKGYYNFFTNTYIYGKIIYDSLIHKVEDNNLIISEINIYPRSADEMFDILRKFSKNYQGKLNNCHIICLNGVIIKLYNKFINNLYDLFSINQNIQTIDTIYKL